MTNLQDNLAFFVRNSDEGICDMDTVRDEVEKVFSELQSDSFNLLNAEQQQEVFAKFGKDLFEAIDACTEGFRYDVESEFAADGPLDHAA